MNLNNSKINNLVNNKKYKTVQKESFLEYMRNITNKYICAEEIKNDFELKNMNIGLTTIYRFLKELEKNNKVRVELRNHTKCYQYILDDCNNHYHLKCSKCGNITHFECDEIKKLNCHILKEHSFKVDSNIMITGVCQKCGEV